MNPFDCERSSRAHSEFAVAIAAIRAFGRRRRLGWMFGKAAPHPLVGDKSCPVQAFFAPQQMGNRQIA